MAITIIGCTKMRKIDFYLKEGHIAKDKTVISLSGKYLKKAKNNLITMRILSEIDSKKARESLSIPPDYNAHEWIAVTGYYAMYTAALALLAKIGFRSKNHTATLVVLEEYFVKKKYLDDKDLALIRSAHLQKEEVEKISEARHKREIAQYSVTKQTTKEIAESIQQDAYNFINKVEVIIAK